MLAAFLFVAPAAAQEVDELAQKAIEAHKAGKPAEALAALDEATTAAWLKTPLGFRQALFVKEPPKGFGVYEPAPSSTFDGTAPIIIYAEPIGYGWLPQDGLNIIALSFDIELKDKDGKVVFERKEFLKAQVQGRSRNREFYTTIRLNVTGAPAGAYSATVTANDPATGKSGSFTLPFTIAAK